MREVPFSGRLDVAVACLLVVERHSSIANRFVSRDELSGDVLSLVDDLEVPPECLGDLDAFDVELERSLLRLTDVGWIEDRDEQGVVRFAPRPLADHALVWIRTRLAADARKFAALDRLDRAVTQRVLADYGHLPARDPAHRA